jgi:hypothetical protein
MRVFKLILIMASGFGAFSKAMAWEEQKTLAFITAHNPVLQAYRVVTTAYTPAGSAWDRVLEHTSVYGRAGAGGTDFISGEEQPYILQAGVQINIPLASIKERREIAQKAVEETRAIDEVRVKAMADIRVLRQHEADLRLSESKERFYSNKSSWLQKRVDQGYEDAANLWDIGQTLSEERAAVERLKGLIAAQQYQVANYAGSEWETLLTYLQGGEGLQ